MGKAFFTAILLTGSLEWAERAVLEGIAACDLNCKPAMTLYSRTLRAATEQGAHDRPLEESESAAGLLPAELSRLLKLSPLDCRRCFVLHILAGLPRSACARLLDLSVYEVAEHTSIALKWLAGQGA